jgi:hypothetical protein
MSWIVDGRVLKVSRRICSFEGVGDIRDVTRSSEEQES